jgi:hypothetical protein
MKLMSTRQPKLGDDLGDELAAVEETHDRALGNDHRDRVGSRG